MTDQNPKEDPEDNKSVFIVSVLVHGIVGIAFVSIMIACLVAWQIDIGERHTRGDTQRYLNLRGFFKEFYPRKRRKLPRLPQVFLGCQDGQCIHIITSKWPK